MLCGLALAQATSGDSAQNPAPGGRDQRQGERRRGSGGPDAERFHGVAGEITAINGDTLTLKSLSGSTVQVKTTSSTQFRKDFQTEAKRSDFKVGDNIVVRGEPGNDNQFVAQGIMLRPAGMRGPGGGPMFNLADLGKTFIIGQVMKIDGTTLTIHRPDEQDQQIEVDENTSFRKQRESITLPDIKIGDTVVGRGELKNNVFVPATLSVADPQMVERRKRMQEQSQQEPK